MNSLSIDVGGTKIRVCEYSKSLSLISEFILQSEFFFKKNDREDIQNLLAHIQQLVNNKHFESIGISFKGFVKENKIMYSSLLENKKPINILELCKKYFSFTFFHVDNDVYCMAKAEIAFGVGKQYKNFLYVNLGTGVHPVFVQQGNMIRGEDNLAGEISQMPIWVNETKSYWKTDEILGGIGLKKLSKELSENEYSGASFFTNGNTKLIDIYTTYLAQFLQMASFFFNPKIIVFGGSLTKSSDIWLPLTKSKYFSFPYPFLLAKNLTISHVSNPASLGALL